MLDLIIIALVAAIVVSRFTKFKLPKDPRDRAQRKGDLDRLRRPPTPREDGSNVVDITAATEAIPATSQAAPASKAKQERAQREAAKNLTGLAKIKALDTGFDEQAFLDGTRQAYLFFYTCWNAKDEEGLAKLCAPTLHDRLVAEMADRSWRPVQVDEIFEVELKNARVHGKTAVIEVQFDTREREGTMPARALQRRWVLARPLGSDDPNWELEDIHTGADA